MADNLDTLSVLSFPDFHCEVQQAPETKGCSTKNSKKYFCKFANCPKSFAHSPSLYRHYRLDHAGSISPKKYISVNTMRSNDIRSSSSSLFNNNSRVQNSHASQQAIQNITQELQQQMFSANAGVQYSQLKTVLETVFQADKTSMIYLKTFSCALQLSLQHIEEFSENFGDNQTQTRVQKRTLGEMTDENNNNVDIQGFSGYSQQKHDFENHSSYAPINVDLLNNINDDKRSDSLERMWASTQYVFGLGVNSCVQPTSNLAVSALNVGHAFGADSSRQSDANLLHLCAQVPTACQLDAASTSTGNSTDASSYFSG